MNPITRRALLSAVPALAFGVLAQGVEPQCQRSSHGPYATYNGCSVCGCSKSAGSQWYHLIECWNGSLPIALCSQAPCAGHYCTDYTQGPG